MELWIRSQNREELIPIKTKLKIYEGDLIQTGTSSYTTERHFNILHNTDFLGEYKNKKRTLEVLDEIQELLMGRIHERHINKFDIYNGDNHKVYEMPEE